MDDYNIDGIDPWYDYYKEPFHSENVFRYSTGGASPQIRGAASQLMTQNAGTVGANLGAAANAREGAGRFRNVMSQLYAGGGGGNYNAIGSIGSNIAGSVSTANMRGYAEGAWTNQEGVQAGGQLSAKADELDQSGKRDSLNYLAALKPEQLSPGWGQVQQDSNQEGFWPGLGKGLLAGFGGLLTGGLGGFLVDELFNKKRPGRDGDPYAWDPSQGTPQQGAYSPYNP